MLASRGRRRHHAWRASFRCAFPTDLAGNHFLTVIDGLDRLPDVGRHVLWHGALPLTIEAA
jgi:hypothetical protein